MCFSENKVFILQKEVEENCIGVNTSLRWIYIGAKVSKHQTLSRRKYVSASKRLASKCRRQTVSAQKYLNTRAYGRRNFSAPKRQRKNVKDLQKKTLLEPGEKRRILFSVKK